MPPRLAASGTALCALATLAVTTIAAAPVSSSLPVRLVQPVRQAATAEDKQCKAAPVADAARHIEVTLASLGYTVQRQQYRHHGKQVSNIEVSLTNIVRDLPPSRTFIIGAHYDAGCGAAQASDDGSGAAAVLELARRLRGARLGRGTALKFVFFVSEDAPHNQALAHGRAHYLAGLAEPYSHSGSFIAFAGTQTSSARVRKALARFMASPFPIQGLAPASYVEGVTWSGLTPDTGRGYPAIMITNTAFLRYPYYHPAHDGSDYPSMARVVDALAKVIEDLAGAARM